MLRRFHSMTNYLNNAVQKLTLLISCECALIQGVLKIHVDSKMPIIHQSSMLNDDATYGKLHKYMTLSNNMVVVIFHVTYFVICHTNL